MRHIRAIELDLITIPAGSFIMGASELREEDVEYYEMPERQVWLSDYRIQRIPVSMAQWRIFLEDENYEWIHQDIALKRSPSDSHPVVHVSWFDAYQFTIWLSKKLKANYSLPTEAQWEKACRGQQSYLYPWGNIEKDWTEEFSAYLKTNLPVGCRPEKLNFLWMFRYVA